MRHFAPTWASSLVLLGAPIAWSEPVSASAAELPSAAVLEPVTSTADAPGFVSAVARVVRARLDDLHVVRTAATPALSFGELQLAVGCVGETVPCLRAVAQQMEVDELVFTTVDRAGAEVVVTLARFEAKSGADPRRSVRRARGDRAESEVLDAIDGALRELYGLPPAPKIAPVVTEPARTVPWVIVGAGSASALVGGVFAVLAASAKDDYASAPVATRNDVDRAIELREGAESKGTASIVFLSLGAAAIAAGVTLFFLPVEHDAPIGLVPWSDGQERAGVLVGGAL